MRKFLKCFLSISLIILILCSTVVCSFAASYESEDNDSYATADSISLNGTVGGVINSSDDKDYYKLTPNANGKISINFKHNYEESDDGWIATVYCYSNGTYTELSSIYVSLNDSEIVTMPSIGAVSGRTYYIQVQYYHYYLTGADTVGEEYSIKTSFVSTDYYEKELNDSYSTADSISLNETIGGTIGLYNDKDYYKFAPSTNGKISINFKHNYEESADGWIATVYCYLNGTYTELSSIYVSLNDSEIVTMPSIGVVSGRTYYIQVQYYHYYLTGADTVGEEYSIKTSFVSTDYYEKELNDSYSTATSLKLNNSYSGVLNSTNDKDYYKLTPSTNGKISINFKHTYEDMSDGWTVTVYCYFNGTYTEMSSTNIGLRDSNNIVIPSISVISGRTYYIQVQYYHYYLTGADTVGEEYSIEAKHSISVPTPTNVKITPASTTSLKVTYNKVSGASSYQVYNKTTGKYYSTTANSYTITGLKVGTAYNIYVRTVLKQGGSTYTSGWSKGITISTKPATPTSFKVTPASTTSLKVTFNKVSGATAYHVYNKTTGKIYTTTSNAYTITGLKAGTSYNIYVRAVRKTSGGTAIGGWAKGITTATKPSTPSFVAGGGSGYFVTKITKVSGASGYRITYATNNKFSNAKNLNVTALNTSIKGYKKGQTVYVKVRAYKKVGSTVIWGAYSKAKAVKIK